MGTIEPVDKQQDTKHQYVPERMYIQRQLRFGSNSPPGTRHKEVEEGAREEQAEEDKKHDFLRLWR